MNSLSKLLAITYVLVCIFTINASSQNTFKTIYNRDPDGTNLTKFLYEDSTGYKIYSILGLLKIDTSGNINSSIKGFSSNGFFCSSINSAHFYSFCGSYFNKPFLMKSDLNFDSLFWAKSYQTTTDTLSFRNLYSGWNNSLLYSGPLHLYSDTLFPEFGEIDTSGHIIRSFKDSTLEGYCQFTYLLDSSTYLVGINSTFGPILLEIDTIGNILFQKRILNRNSKFTSSTQIVNNEITIIGVEDFSVLSNIFILNYSLGGIINWSKECTLLSYDSWNGFAPTITNCADGGYLITATGGLISTVSYEPNVELIKLNPAGDSLWSVCHGSISTFDEGITSIETSDHGFLTFGSSTTHQFNWITNPVPYIIKTDSTGHTSTNCQESYFPFTINNLTIQDSSLSLNFYPITYQDTLVSVSFSTINNIQSLDGCSLSAVEKISSRKQQNNFTIYPNPTKEKLKVQCLTTYCKINKIEVLNLNGQLINAFTINHLNDVEVDISFLEKGAYLLKVHSENNSETFSFIKE